jgi:hypothetical protein
MNERIKALALQAGVTGYFAAGTEYATLIPLSDEVQKFAELIVQECAKVAEDIQKFYDEHNDSQVNTEIWTMIKVHFGVEE